MMEQVFKDVLPVGYCTGIRTQLVEYVPDLSLIPAATCNRVDNPIQCQVRGHRWRHAHASSSLVRIVPKQAGQRWSWAESRPLLTSAWLPRRLAQQLAPTNLADSRNRPSSQLMRNPGVRLVQIILSMRRIHTQDVP